jgi:hypothetical protein
MIKLILFIIKLIKDLLIGTIMLPLDIILIPIALVVLSIKKIYVRYKNIEGDLKTAIPVIMHKIKQKIKQMRRK